MVHVVLSGPLPPPSPPVVFFFKSNSDVNGSVNGACDDVIKKRQANLRHKLIVLT